MKVNGISVTGIFGELGMRHRTSGGLLGFVEGADLVLRCRFWKIMRLLHGDLAITSQIPFVDPLRKLLYTTQWMYGRDEGDEGNVAIRYE